LIIHLNTSGFSYPAIIHVRKCNDAPGLLNFRFVRQTRQGHGFQAIVDAAHALAITVIAGITLETDGARKKGLALFCPNQRQPMRYPQGSGACLIPGNPQLTIVEGKTELLNIDPLAALYTCSQAVGETRWRDAINRLQRFAHKYAITVLMANSDGHSALWDSSGQLIVRADRGELLLTGTWGKQGWQGDIIPLR